VEFGEGATLFIKEVFVPVSGAEAFSLIIGFVVVTAVAFVVICLVASLLRFQGMAEDVHAAADTGQVGLDGWGTALAARLSMVPSAPAPFSILQLVPRSSEEQGDLAEYAEALRCALRPRDRVFLLEGGRIGILLAARRESLRVVIGRLRQRPAFDIAAWAIGAATYPENGARVDPLLKAADEALDQALDAGPAPFSLAGAPAEDLPAEISAEAPPPSDLVDALTGTLSPARFMPSLQKLTTAVRRDGEALSLLLIRIEHLARYREHYGVEAADTLLAALGKILRRGVREEDLPVRIDEEQMGVMLHCGGDDAERVAERLAEQVRSKPVTHAGSELKMAIHVGIATAPVDARSGRALFDCAVCAANEAASQVRGACVRYDEERMAPGPVEEDAAPQVY
jgi:diguanylate cyclase (GGDEF)-like protein